MNVPDIPTPKDLINAAFSRARKKAIQKKKLIDREMLRIDISANVVLDTIHNISILDINSMTPFYRELLDATVDVLKMKGSLNKIRWAKKKILTVKRITLKGYTKLKPSEAIKKRKVFYGRLNSVLRGIERDFDFLRDCCKAIANMPQVKEMETVIIAGFPNAGKSSLLKALTGSEPDIQPYPFTTKGLMMGYSKIGYNKIQFIDTPGLLDRPLEKSNNIEKRAIAALRHLSATIIFVVDPLYDIDSQLRLLEGIKSELKSKIIIVVNKSDLDFNKEEISAKIEGISISAKDGTGIEELRAIIGQYLKQ